MLDPLTVLLLGNAVTSSAGFSIQSLASVFNSYYDRKLERERMNHSKLIESDRIKAIIESKKQEFKHQELMFEKTREKEIELQQFEFEHQKLLAHQAAVLDLEKFDRKYIYEDFPLDIAPPVIINSKQEMLIIVRNEEIPALDDAQNLYLTRIRKFESSLEDFISNLKEKGNVFLVGDENWKDGGKYRGLRAANSLHIYLKDRPTLFMEYRIIGDEVKFNTFLWGAFSGEEKLQSHEMARFSLKDMKPEQILKKLEILRFIATGGFTDIYGMLKNFLSPKSISFFPQFNELNDKDITKAMKDMLTSHLYVLARLEDLYPRSANFLYLSLFKELKRISIPDLLKHFLDTKIKIDIIKKNLPKNEDEIQPESSKAENIPKSDDSSKNSSTKASYSKTLSIWKKQNEKK